MEDSCSDELLDSAVRTWYEKNLFSDDDSPAVLDELVRSLASLLSRRVRVAAHTMSVGCTLLWLLSIM